MVNDIFSLFFADTNTKMCRITDIVEYLSLNEVSEKRGNKIVKVAGKKRELIASQMWQVRYEIKSLSKEVQNMCEKVL